MKILRFIAALGRQTKTEADEFLPFLGYLLRMLGFIVAAFTALYWLGALAIYLVPALRVPGKDLFADRLDAGLMVVFVPFMILGACVAAYMFTRYLIRTWRAA